MNTTDLKEKNFEADIERYLITEGGYIKAIRIHTTRTGLLTCLYLSPS